MKKIITLLLVIITSCSPQVKEEQRDLVVKTLEDFFIRCEQDIERASKVILDHDIIKNLTHLKMMNAGGRKYYLLERESISDMINAVTEGVYADYILINKEGDIIYTRTNDDIFGKNVRTSLAKTPLKACYENRDIPVFFQDVTPLSDANGEYYIFVSTKVKGGNTFPGIFILQFDVEKLREVLDKKTDIIGADGLFRLSGKPITPYTPYEYFSNINAPNPKNGDRGVFSRPGGTTSYRFFSHDTINWILIREN
ncbi:MAG TPA: hypothetical protein PK926_12265 [Spirochaetota bacterium]|nr:hypothetical protein [Spirochaetota bacterium]HPI89732.1 hypothetical protein [Spirochaetota bacterium]HPR46635.1 hypothetical protein [Spirochaetota bacterium]